MTRVCAVILNWKDAERTLRCFAALTAIPAIDHIFVVDNEADGELRDRLGAPSPRWSLIEFPENRGFAGGVNPALTRSLSEGFDATLVINNDATIDAASVESLVGSLVRNASLALVAPRIVTADGQLESAGGFVSPLLGQADHRPRRRHPDYITWACVLVRSRDLRELGLLDERFFMYWEDVDYSLRLRAAGRRFGIDPEATAMHETSANRRAHPLAIKAYHTWSAILFARKHRGQWLVGNVVWIAASALANLARGRGGALAGLRAGIRLADEGATPAYSSRQRTRDL